MYTIYSTKQLMYGGPCWESANLSPLILSPLDKPKPAPLLF